MRKILTALVLIVLSGVGGIWIGIPYLERRWIYFPVDNIPGETWDLPEGAEKVLFTAADGVHLGGWYLEGIPPRNGITILFLHGNVGALPRFVPDAEFMRQRGFNVLLFNFRGFGMSEGETLGEATLKRDGAAALRYLTKQRGIDPRSIAFVGASTGAPIAANLAARSPCRAVALVSGLASVRRQIQYAKPRMPALILGLFGNQFDTAGVINRAKCPVLVIHAADDTVIPLTHAQEVYDAARQPKRFIVVPGTGHIFEGVDHAIYLEGMSSFFINAK